MEEEGGDLPLAATNSGIISSSSAALHEEASLNSFTFHKRVGKSDWIT